MLGRRTLAGAIGRAVVMGVPALALAVYVADLPIADYAGIPAGLLIGCARRAAGSDAKLPA